ncbi:MAG: hypothetical protein ABI200_02080, partial [Gaiellales bacterium]
LRLVERLVQDGVDIDQFARSLAEHLRSILLQLHGLDQHTTVGDPARLVSQAAGANETRMLAAIDCLADAATRMRVGSDARISLETALVRACQGLGLPSLAMRIAALEHGATGSYGKPLPTGAAPAAPAAPATPAPSPAPSASASPAAPPARPTLAPASAQAATMPASATSAPVVVDEEAPVPAKLDEQQLGEVAAWWPKVAQLVAKSPAHRPMLQALTPEAVDARHLSVRMSTVVPVSVKLKETMATAVFEITGHRLSIEVLDPVASAPTAAPAASTAPAPTPTGAPARPAPASAPAAASSEPDAGIENLMSMFDATPVAPGTDNDQ